MQASAFDLLDMECLLTGRHSHVHHASEALGCAPQTDGARRMKIGKRHISKLFEILNDAWAVV